MSGDRFPPERRFKHPIGMGVWGILWRDWDPIGMKQMDGPDDEYDAYVWPLIGKIMQGADREDVADYLDWATNVHMELGGDRARVRAQHLILADRLVSLKTTES